ncbi:MAG: hypothetical protein GC185_03855 [Alphaproteobacteria bacterium]|nr:hypothetical protein [Alphaproteobacteria bacterium]
MQEKQEDALSQPVVAEMRAASRGEYLKKARGGKWMTGMEIAGLALFAIGLAGLVGTMAFVAIPVAAMAVPTVVIAAGMATMSHAEKKVGQKADALFTEDLKKGTMLEEYKTTAVSALKSKLAQVRKLKEAFRLSAPRKTADTAPAPDAVPAVAKAPDAKPQG